MKVGAEDRKKVAIAGVLMVAALLLVVRMLLVDSGPSASAPPSFDQGGAASAQPVRTNPRRLSRGKKQQTATSNLDPRLRLDLLKSSEDVRYAGTGRNIFLSREEPPIPKPVSDPRLDKGKIAQTQTPPPPPPPPPIELKFFGFANKPGQPRRVFLAKGQDVFIAGEGDIVDRRYKVLRIGPTSIELQDVLNNNRQSIPITQG
ncbi:MAG TPA: hypothetical protein VET69_08985 [Terriglobales bacterium]|nr:hypothetical protein [Terriglobales bacterium]